jgi:hypothetical protein
VVGDDRLGVRRPEHGPHGLHVAPHVVLQLPVREVEERFYPPAGVVVVDVDRQQAVDARVVHHAPRGVRRLLFAQLLDLCAVHRGVLVHELVVERVLFLAEEVHLVAPTHEGAAEVLYVDIAPRPGEHVPVCH